MSLSLRLLGRMEVRAGTRAVPGLARRKAYALLAYLSLAPAQCASRDELATLLWGDRDDAHARASLRQALTRLRRWLEPYHPDLLAGDRQSVGLVAGGIDTDVARFERLCRGGSRAELAEAVALYRGDFLTGLHVREEQFEEWQLGERIRLQRLATDALERLAAAQLERGETLDALATGRRLLAIDPLREPGHRLVMRALARSGQRSAALAQYRVCRRTLGEALQVRPDDETERLLEAIRTRAEAGGATAEVPARAPPAGSTVASPPGATGAAGAERRQVTVMRCGLVDGEARAACMDPEDYRELLAASQATVGAVVEQYGGHVARSMGEGLIAYFGYPQAHEDDAERAVRAGLDVVAALGGLGSPAVTRGIRVGIATGLVVIGDPPAGLTSDGPGIAGAPLALAEALQGRAEPDRVEVSGATARMIAGRFELDPAEPADGSRYRVVAAIPGAPRFAGRAARRLSPFVGRAEELEFLARRWTRARDGRGQAILVAGEAGIGKSRLVERLRERIGTEPHQTLALQCSSYHASSALHPVIAALGAALAPGAAGNRPPALAALERHLEETGGPDEEILGLLAHLLAIPVDGGFPAVATMSSGQRRERTLRALMDYVCKGARRIPALWLFEDVHWADASTGELLSRLAPAIERERVLLIATTRPGHEAEWADLAHAGLLRLPRLAPEAAGELVRAVASDRRALPPEVVETILTRSEGNPLFIEELTRTVAESAEPVTSSRTVPATLQDSLAARLDGSEAGRAVAQCAAVIGRRFDRALLERTWDGSPRRLDEGLEALERAGLVSRQGQGDHACYTFKHALVRDVAYESVLRASRATWHRRIAAALGSRTGEAERAPPELLAHHYAAAGDADRAIEYWQAAGRRAIRSSAYVEATEHARAGLRLLRSASAADPASELALQLILGSALAMTAGYGADQTGAAFERAGALCERLPPTPDRFRAVLGRWRFHMTRADYREAGAVVDQMHALARRGDGVMPPGVSDYAAGFTALSLGDVRGALGHLDRSIAACPDGYRGSPVAMGGTDTQVAARAYAGLALWIRGYPDRALERALDAIRLAESIRSPGSVALASLYAAWTTLLRGDPASPGRHVETVLSLSEQHAFPFFLGWGEITAGWTAAGADPRRAREHIERGRAVLERIGSGDMWLPLQQMARGHVLLGAGQRAEAVRHLDAGLRACERAGERLFEAELLRVRGDALAGGGASPADVEDCYRRAIESAVRQDARSWQLRASLGLARHRRERAGERRVARLLEPILGWFTEGADTPDLVQARRLLEGASRRRRCGSRLPRRNH